MKALSKKVDSRYQSCQDLLDDIEAVRHRYPTAPRAAAAANVSAVKDAARAVAVASADGLAFLESPVGSVRPSTDDTVDSLPVGMFNGDDTVTMKVPSTWMQRVTERIDSAVTGAFARVKRSDAQNPPASTGLRKR